MITEVKTIKITCDNCRDYQIKYVDDYPTLYNTKDLLPDGWVSSPAQSDQTIGYFMTPYIITCQKCVNNQNLK